MSQVKLLLKSRSFKFIHPDVVETATDEEVPIILKSVSYFKNLNVFKNLYHVLYKSRNMNIDNFKELHKDYSDYIEHHPDDYIVKGFEMALNRGGSNVIKSLYRIFVVNNPKTILSASSVEKKLIKTVSSYYNDGKRFNVAIVTKDGILKICNENIVKTVCKWKV